MRVKYWRGRSVHSPFLYNVIREGFMKNENLPIDESFFNKLRENTFSYDQAMRVCRLFTHLGYETYTFDTQNYNGEDMVIVSGELNPNEISAIAKQNRSKRRTICVVVRAIYKDKRRHQKWNLLSVITGGVAVDLYHNGYLFIDRFLNRQNFKMRF